ncbi:MAG: 16S rRNA (cytosine(967)-C(5))-methyltransferase RsmB [Chromatiaceae bacterium]|nr:16S rRNA (cytosine(967)-C(5))-methyltransferase RsmB [Chromatiaceae bacterium]MCP5422508.1 16S rRNA (cytosine(967)-C(5))-methyltransferase RsmB [Chromatiaceae bacterium]
MGRASGDPRLAAVSNVLAVTDGRSLDAVVAANAHSVDERDRALVAELSYGVCRWYRRLDALIGGLLQRPFKARDRDLHMLLLVGAYQLLHSRVPGHAAVSTAVDACRLLGKGWASKLVNGVLRRLQREQAQLEADVDRVPAVRYAQPDWLYEQIVSGWPAQAATILQALQQRPPMVLRVDTARIARADYLAGLAQHGIAARAHATVDSAVVLDRAVAVEQLPDFDRGLVSVQDAGAQLAAAWLDLQPGQCVLDACAAPGGKTLAILQRATGLDVTALDIDAERLQRVAQNLARAEVHADLVVADAALPPAEGWGAGNYARILVDAPCSATGVMRRHPDIRLLRRASDVEALVARQAAILDALWPLLAPRGRLLYVTCSLLPAENARQIDAFVERHADALVAELPIGPGLRAGKGVQLLPGVDDTDGFFYAALIKGASNNA